MESIQHIEDRTRIETVDTFADKPPPIYQEDRSRSLSYLAGLDALALACAAEHSMNEDGTIIKADLNMESLQQDRSLTPDDSAENTRESSSPTSMSSSANYISQDLLQEIPSYISVNDVLCGRGGLTNHHPGNIYFRNLVRLRQEEYLRASKRDKSNVAKEIVELVRNQDPPGRFLKKISEKSNAWTEIGDRKAREKTSQALREGAPELRGEMYLKSSDVHFPGINYSEFMGVMRSQVVRGQLLHRTPENNLTGMGAVDADHNSSELSNQGLNIRDGTIDIDGDICRQNPNIPFQ